MKPMNREEDMAREDDEFLDEFDRLLNYTVEIVVAQLSNNNVAVGAVPDFIRDVHSALANLGASADEPEEFDEPEAPEEMAAPPTPVRSAPTPAVPIGQSLQYDYLVCLECGKKAQMLRRHLQMVHGLTPGEYRAKWRLSDDYPLVSPKQSAAMAARSKALGLADKMAAAR